MKNNGLILFDAIDSTPIREMLIYDKLVIPEFEKNLSKYYDLKVKPTSLLTDLEYLYENDIIVEPHFENDGAARYYEYSFSKYGIYEALGSDFNNEVGWSNKDLIEELKAFCYSHSDKRAYDGFLYAPLGKYDYQWTEDGYNKVKHLEDHNEYYSLRFLSRLLNEFSTTRHIPVLSNGIPEPKLSNQKLTSQDILEICINNILIPDRSIPLADLIQFKIDEDTVFQLNALRLWAQELSSQTEDDQYIADLSRHRIEEYNRFMKLQNMKYSTGSLEFVVTTSASVIENLLKLNFEKVVQSILKLRYNKIQLLESEFSAPGREVAYISNANRVLTSG